MGDAINCAAEIDAMFDKMASEFKKEGVYTGYLFTTLSTNGFLIEPIFYWPE